LLLEEFKCSGIQPVEAGIQRNINVAGERHTSMSWMS
jgi:hypothetical protein